MNRKFKRVFVIVLDSFGIGELPDAPHYGDLGANTFKSISRSNFFKIDNLRKLGLCNIEGAEHALPDSSPIGAYGRLAEKSRGKDTTVGHFELMGVVSERPLPTYPNGFPDEIISKFSEVTGRGVLCNKPYSGTDVIRVFGEEHLKSGKLIVYTSADSVFQIAAHEDTVPPEVLYDYCKAARELLCGEHAVGRVIARPFIGTPGNFKRTANRRDFSLEPPSDTVLDGIKNSGKSVIAIGKITDIFAGRGITESIFTHSNSEGITQTLRIQKTDFSGLCFTNLVDFDMLYGHRQDADGYANALAEFDSALPLLMDGIGDDGLLIITADHGCDPSDSSTDHTREYVPLLIYAKGITPTNLGTLQGLDTVGRLVADALDLPLICKGEQIHIL